MKSKKVDGKTFSLLEFLIINLKESQPEMLEFAKMFVPFAEAVKIDIDILEGKLNEIGVQITNLERDINRTKDYIQTLTESEEEEINGVDRLENISS